jgi:PPOX class probable F420-dependent enzyme
VSFAIDEGTEFGARAAAHLRKDRVAWLTTVTPTGAPIPSPVWFWWEEPATVRMFSRAGTPRQRNLEANPRVALHFPGDGEGGDIVVLSGHAVIDPDGPAVTELPGYLEKYAAGFERIGVTPEQFITQYPVRVRIDLTRLRGH